MVKCHTAYTKRTRRVPQGVAVCAMVLGLAACAAPAPDVGQIGLRNPTVTLAGTTRFDAARFAGDWRTVACIGECADAVSYRVAKDDVILRSSGAAPVAYAQSARGVLREVAGGGTLVVMWVDTGFRTAAIGDADGRWAAVLDRRRSGGADRVAAATEILDFNGWDVAKLKVIK